MRAGYLPLLGVLLAFSAYKGGMHPTTTTTTGPPPEESRRLPAISAGVCDWKIGIAGEGPPKNCSPIQPTNDLLDLIESYYQPYTSDPSSKPKEWLWNIPYDQVSRIQFVIALVPDPVHTHLSLTFDRQIEAIEKAAQAQGYLYSRSWMPWDISTHPESTDFTVRMAEDEVQQQREDIPGLMIFRKPTSSSEQGATDIGQSSNGQEARKTSKLQNKRDKESDETGEDSVAHKTAKDTLFVFVVGETPTGGIHAKQFQNALNIQLSVAQQLSTDRRPPLLIFGPTFSGSLDGLTKTLAHYRTRAENKSPDIPLPKILVRSGTVGSFQAAHSFCVASQSNWINTSLSPTAPDFATFQFSDKYEDFYLSTFFADRHQMHSHVAILSEDETEYGDLDQSARASSEQSGGGADGARSIADVNQPTNQDSQGSSHSSSQRNVAENCPAPPPKPLLPLIHLYFPREIAQLRSAYEQNLKEQPAAKPEGYVPPQTRLPLTLGVTGKDDDSVPPFAPLQTPLSQDAIMQAIVSTLRKQHAKVVIIRASDPLDMVFLARYLRQNYPQARLVTSGADLLMVYDVTDPRFHGILSVTSYPLLNGVDFPRQPPDCFFLPDPCAVRFDDEQANEMGGFKAVQRSFSDHNSVGSYNAFLSLLASEGPPAGACGLPNASYAQFGLPSFLEDTSSWRPHLWLTTVGNDGYWPVSVLDSIEPEHIDALRQEIRTKTRNPFAGKGTCCLTKSHDATQQEPEARPEPTVRSLPSRGIPPGKFQVHLTIGWSIFWLISVALSIGASYLLICPPMHAQKSELLGRFSRSNSPSRNCLLMAGIVVLLLIQTLFAFPAFAWLLKYGGTYDFRNLPVAGALCILLFSMTYIAGWALLIWYSITHAAPDPKSKAAEDSILADAECPPGWLKVVLAFALGGLGIVHLFFDALWVISIVYLLSLGTSAVACVFVWRRTRFIERPKARWIPISLCGALLTLIFLIPLICLLHKPGNPTEFQSFLYRYVETGSGVSPLLPCFFILAGWLWWWWQSLTGVVSFEEKHIVLPSVDFFGRTIQTARERLRLEAVADDSIWTSGFLNALPRRGHIPILAIAGFACICVLMTPSEIAEAFEGLLYRRIYWYALLYPSLFLICYVASHIVVLWLHLKSILKAVEALPFRRGFADVKDLTWKPLWKLAGAGRNTFVDVLGRELNALRQVQLTYAANAPIGTANISAFKATEDVCKAVEQRKPEQEVRKLFHDLQAKIAEAAECALDYSDQHWIKEEFVPPNPASQDGDSKIGPSEPTAASPALRVIEHFLCLFYLNVILVPLRRLQTLILALAGVFVFVLLSYSSYPFESRESFHALLISILFAISLVVGMVYGQMYSDPLLSRITNTKPGELGLDFWIKMGTFVFIPVLSLLSVQFPEVNSVLFSWLQPALQSLK